MKACCDRGCAPEVRKERGLQHKEMTCREVRDLVVSYIESWRDVGCQPHAMDTTGSQEEEGGEG